MKGWVFGLLVLCLSTTASGHTYDGESAGEAAGRAATEATQAASEENLEVEKKNLAREIKALEESVKRMQQSGFAVSPDDVPLLKYYREKYSELQYRTTSSSGSPGTSPGSSPRTSQQQQ